MKKYAPSLLVALLFALVVHADGTAVGLPGLPGRASTSGGGGGAVNSVTATAPVTSSGGANPNIAVTNAVLQQSLATASLFVDPIGNDSNACTAGGASACATLSGAFSKLPNYRVANNVTIAVAAGTYDDSAQLLDEDVNANITINGPALQNATVATGTATGSLSAANDNTPALMTDGTQTWTVNNLMGMFLVMTSGAASGEVRVIATNTSTAMTLASPFNSPPSAADTYAIQVPAAIISPSSGDTALVLRLTGNSGASAFVFRTIIFSQIDFLQPVDDSIGCEVALSNQTVRFNKSRCLANGGTAGQGMYYFGGGTVRVNVFSGMGSGGGLAFFDVGVTGSINPVGAFSPNNGFFYGDQSAAIDATSSTNSTVEFNATADWTAQTNQTSPFFAAFTINTVFRHASSSNETATFRCLSAGGPAILQGFSTGDSSATEFIADNIAVYGCDTGIDLSQGEGNALVTAVQSFTCRNTGTCISVANGSRMKTSGTINSSGITNALSIDGTFYTFSDLTTATPTRITQVNTGSSIWE